MEKGIMHLKQYPKAIATQQTQLLELRQAMRQVRETIAGKEIDIDKAVVFDDTLKNEAQRKVKRSELVHNDVDLLYLLERLDALDDQKKAAEIDLNRLMNQLAIAKLEKRQTIAQMETEARLAS
jgi:hypothetical protein